MPVVIVLAGINGAGKSTAAVDLLRSAYRSPAFLNADTIARGLNGVDPESVAAEAGRVLLQRLSELAAASCDFAFETTLAGRAYAHWLSQLRSRGYECHLYYYWLSSPEAAIARVAARVRSGGHSIPDATIRLRYPRSVRNFIELYHPLADLWKVYDNTNGMKRIIGEGQTVISCTVHDSMMWAAFERSCTCI